MSLNREPRTRRREAQLHRFVILVPVGYLPIIKHMPSSAQRQIDQRRPRTKANVGTNWPQQHRGSNRRHCDNHTISVQQIAKGGSKSTYQKRNIMNHQPAGRDDDDDVSLVETGLEATFIENP